MNNNTIIKDADDYYAVHGPGSLKKLLETAQPADGAAPSITGVHNFLAPFMPNLRSRLSDPGRI